MFGCNGVIYNTAQKDPWLKAWYHSQAPVEMIMIAKILEIV